MKEPSKLNKLAAAAITKREAEMAAQTDDYSKIIYGIPQGLRGLVKATAAFRDRFGSARETITNRGVIIRLKA